jgi:hypothetical protein
MDETSCCKIKIQELTFLELIEFGVETLLQEFSTLKKCIDGKQLVRRSKEKNVRKIYTIQQLLMANAQPRSTRLGCDHILGNLHE